VAEHISPAKAEFAIPLRRHGHGGERGVPFVQEVFATRWRPPASRNRLHHRAGRGGRQDPLPDRGMECG
jgi:hypothetical protein